MLFCLCSLQAEPLVQQFFEKPGEKLVLRFLPRLLKEVLNQRFDDSPAVQPLEEAVKKISSKEQMAAKMEERRKLEGLLPQEPQEATWHVNACDMCL